VHLGTSLGCIIASYRYPVHLSNVNFVRAHVNLLNSLKFIEGFDFSIISKRLLRYVKKHKDSLTSKQIEGINYILDALKKLT